MKVKCSRFLERRGWDSGEKKSDRLDVECHVGRNGVDRMFWHFAPVLVRDRLRRQDHRTVGAVWVMMNVRKPADLAISNAFPFHAVKASPQACANEIFAIGENHVEAELVGSIHLAGPSHDLSEDGSKGIENWPFRIIIVKREDQAKNVLAVRRAADGVAVVVMQGSQHHWPDLIETGYGAVVDERPTPIRERVSVLRPWRPHCRTPNVSQHSLRVDPGRGAAKVLAMEGGPSLAFDAGSVVFVCSDTPTVRIRLSFHIPSALHHQSILGMDQGALDFRGLIGPKSVKATHSLGSRLVKS